LANRLNGECRGGVNLDQIEPTRLLQFLNVIRRSRVQILAEYSTPLAFCDALLNGRTSSRIASKAATLLAGYSSDLRDYQVASAYALLMGKHRRKELSAYFTPPALTAAAIAAAAPFLAGRASPSILDPACGGGAFLVPLARSLARAHVAKGARPVRACTKTIEQMQGIELDEGLATLSRRLLASMFYEEFGVALGREARSTIRRADTLITKLDQRFDLVVGNPPYGRIGSRLTPAALMAAGRANNGGHTNFYSLFLMRALDWVKPGGGLVFILPTSFVAGPYFSGLRQEILDRADVVRIDLHEQRENLFVGAVQDVCMLTLRRHSKAVGRAHHAYDIGIVDAFGGHKSIGFAETPTNGEPWMLPVATNRHIIIPTRLAQRASRYFTLTDYGSRIRVGKVVPTRERESLRTTPTKGTLPLLWASAVRPDGTFSATGGGRSKNPLWFLPPVKDVPFATKGPSVLVQRTSNRDQNRRLNAAPVCPKFLKVHRQHGFVAENHVIILEALDDPRVSPASLAQILNSPAANQRFSAVSGSFSVSAKILGRLALPDPDLLPLETDKKFTAKIEACFEAIDGVLVPLPNAHSAQHAVEKTCNLRSRVALDDDTRLKARRFA
jgi:adenine-specific DNA-methyltransferase